MSKQWVWEAGAYRVRGADAARCVNQRCAQPMNAGEPAEGGGAPADGDVAVCAYCGTAATWADGTSRLVLLDETTLDHVDLARLAAVRRQIARGVSS